MWQCHPSFILTSTHSLSHSYPRLHHSTSLQSLNFLFISTNQPQPTLLIDALYPYTKSFSSLPSFLNLSCRRLTNLSTSPPLKLLPGIHHGYLTRFYTIQPQPNRNPNQSQLSSQHDQNILASRIISLSKIGKYMTAYNLYHRVYLPQVIEPLMKEQRQQSEAIHKAGIQLEKDQIQLSDPSSSSPLLSNPNTTAVTLRDVLPQPLLYYLLIISQNVHNPPLTEEIYQLYKLTNQLTIKIANKVIAILTNFGAYIPVERIWKDLIHYSKEEGCTYLSPNIDSYNTMIRLYKLVNQPNQCRKIWEQLRQHPTLHPTSTSYCAALSASIIHPSALPQILKHFIDDFRAKTVDFPEGTSVEIIRSQRHSFLLQNSSFNNLLQALPHDIFTNILPMLKEARSCLNLKFQDYAITLSAYARFGLIDEVIEIEHEMLEKGFQHNQKTLTTILIACSKGNKTNLQRQTISKMIEYQRIHAPSSMYLSHSQPFEKKDEFNESVVADQPLEKLKEEMRLRKNGDESQIQDPASMVMIAASSLDLFSLTSVIISLTRQNEEQAAISLFQRLENEKVFLDMAIYNAVMYAASKLGNVALIKKLISNAKDRGLELTMASLFALQFAYTKNHDLVGVRTSMEMMRIELGREPDDKSWRTYLSLIVKMNEPTNLILQTIDEMMSLNIVPNADNILSALKLMRRQLMENEYHILHQRALNNEFGENVSCVLRIRRQNQLPIHLLFPNDYPQSLDEKNGLK